MNFRCARWGPRSFTPSALMQLWPRSSYWMDVRCAMWGPSDFAPGLLQFGHLAAQSKDWERLHCVLNGWICLRSQRVYSLNGNTIVATHLDVLGVFREGKTEGLTLFHAVTTSWKQAHQAELRANMWPDVAYKHFQANNTTQQQPAEHAYSTVHWHVSNVRHEHTCTQS